MLNLKNAVESTTSGYCTDSLKDCDDFLLHPMGAPSAKNRHNLSKNQHRKPFRDDSTAFFRLKSILVGIFCLGFSLISSVQALPFSRINQIYFFGDSLTDCGFYNALPFEAGFPVGKAPTFTTYGGFTWSQLLAMEIKGFQLPQGYPVPNPPDMITNNTTPLSPVPGPAPVIPDLTGICYAAGGSTTDSIGFGFPWAPSLIAQVNNFLSQIGTIDPADVIFVWSGANDLLTLLSASPLPSQLQLLMAANNATTNIANEVAILSNRGAKRVVVMALPNIGYTPLILDVASSNPSLPASVKNLTFTFNSMLNQKLGSVILSHPQTKILLIDVYDLLDNVILATQAGQPYVVAGEPFFFVNYTTPACGAVPSAIFCPPGTPSGYIFADTLHPTGEAHSLLARYVATKILAWA
jgi:outer membrane lipase/esterase